MEEIKWHDRITDGKRLGTVTMVYPSTGEVAVKWDGAKRQSIQKIANIRKV